MSCGEQIQGQMSDQYRQITSQRSPWINSTLIPVAVSQKTRKTMKIESDDNRRFSGDYDKEIDTQQNNCVTSPHTEKKCYVYYITFGR